GSPGGGRHAGGHGVGHHRAGRRFGVLGPLLRPARAGCRPRLATLTQMCVAGARSRRQACRDNEGEGAMGYLVVMALAALAVAWPAAGRAQARVTPPGQNPVREISKIAGDVYRFRNNNPYSVFAVTPAGIIATDPINAPAATWLKDELKKRWPDKPIKFVV